MIITDDGRIFEGDVELFELTVHQQDALIKQLYPDDKTLLSVTDMAKKSTSFTGTHAFDVDRFATYSAPYVESGNCEVAERVYRWGGQRLLTLYCNGFNFYSAALDLGIQYGALHKFWQRWRVKALAAGLKPEDLFRDPDEIVNP